MQIIQERGVKVVIWPMFSVLLLGVRVAFKDSWQFLAAQEWIQLLINASLMLFLLNKSQIYKTWKEDHESKIGCYSQVNIMSINRKDIL